MTAAAMPIATPVLVLVGPTAIGKTALSLAIGERFDCEIISMDSMQVYRFMDIGTAKASREERQRIVHHLIDIVDPDEQYDAARFVDDTLTAITAISARGKIPLITGGTGLYLSALVNGLFDELKTSAELRQHLAQRLRAEGRGELYLELTTVDPESARRIHPNDTQRLLRGLEIFHATGIPWSEHLRRQANASPAATFSHLLQLGLTCERDTLYERIRLRTQAMMQDAFEEEVAALLARGYGPELPSMQAIGYRHMCGCIQGLWDRETATAALIQDTRRYAKRQLTWFKHQHRIHWHHIRQPDKVLADIADFLHTAR
ncbi:tRNA delta(2)-isopentenylpyrophosphate transferase [Desulfobulbus propionicus DSM 2032]|jgi:tRNA dimethylallyltransferase|uniref:tRNA dimethylallyltransferase n=1 Tax=Desulfobulbus propionicus (strain ATCC 33891 / DSM 2032 / VKM B-1956 / 1pr3) TaxID=577650 RepID=A0A7U3YM62_DESPD|nr:tRNA (adenosine(37)-N6)-dimethylallyltransferase MiaA [Desulfobulbus propionicus]ADW17928.1 tRNA delta(2)-isopentenylpyrophosphate transferase [Desulfobulbus propionicus DSM 2032]